MQAIRWKFILAQVPQGAFEWTWTIIICLKSSPKLSEENKLEILKIRYTPEEVLAKIKAQILLQKGSFQIYNSSQNDKVI